MNFKNSGWPWAISACFFSSSIWIFIRALSPVLPVTAQLFWRLFAASILILIIFWKRISTKQLLEISFTDFMWIFLRAFGLYTLGTTLAGNAIQETKYGTVILFLSLPVGGLLATVLLKEKLKPRAWVAIILSSFGVALAVMDRYGISIEGGRGELLAFLASIVMAVALITRRWQSSSLNEFELTFGVLFIGSIQFLVGNIIFKIPLGFDPSLASITLISLSGLWTAAFLYCVAQALMKMKIYKVNLVFGFQPLLGVIIGSLLYQEDISIFSILAALILLSSIFILNRQ